MQENRRHFTRIELTDTATALDKDGFELGRVSQASGGGMNIRAGSAEALRRLQKDAQLLVTIVEQGSETQNSFQVRVCHVHGSLVGLEFL